MMMNGMLHAESYHELNKIRQIFDLLYFSSPKQNVMIKANQAEVSFKDLSCQMKKQSE